MSRRHVIPMVIALTLGSLVVCTSAGRVSAGVPGLFPRDMAVGSWGTTLLVTDFASGQLQAVKVGTLP